MQAFNIKKVAIAATFYYIYLSSVIRTCSKHQQELGQLLS